jgi:transcriptional regulator with XRE-family HTH domain
MRAATRPKHVVLDERIGSQIRDYRTMSGLSQNALATALGISHQQLQKYETGTNRISASRLWHCAEVLGVRITDFFEPPE